MQSKSIFASKTFYLNLAAAAIAWFLNHNGILQAAGVSAQDQVAILAVVNFINRFFTTQPVHVA